MGDGDTAERMSDEHGGFLGGRDGCSDPLRPSIALREIPIVLLDAARGREPRLPARLPMIRAGIAESRDNENVSFV